MSALNVQNFAGRVLLAIVIVIFAAAMALLLWEVRAILLLLFLSMLLATFWRAASRPLVNRLGVPDKAAVAITLVVLAVLFGLISWFFVPRLIDQAEEFVEALPPAIDELQEFMEQTPVGAAILERLPEPDEEIENDEMFGRIFTTVSATGGLLADVTLLLFVAIFFAFTPEVYTRGIVRLVPQSRRRRAREVLQAVGDTVKDWLLGRLIAMIAVGVLVSVGLGLMGVPLALFLGFLAGLLDFIPYIGPIVAAVPAVLVAFVASPVLALWVLVLFLAIQQLESYVISPLAYQKSVSLPPVLTIIGVFVFGVLFGFLGLVAATPIVAVIMVLVKMLYVEDVLEEAA